MYADRKMAGQKLARLLEAYRGPETVVYGLPRGGVPVAAEIARALGAPLDVLLVRKLGVPGQPELAMGAVVDGISPKVVRNQAVIAAYGVDEAAFDQVLARERGVLAERQVRYGGTRVPIPVAGKTAIIVDDGIATGATMKAAIAGLREGGPRRIIVATPVASQDTLDALAPMVDAVICSLVPKALLAIGYHYGDFPQVSDEEVAAALAG
jgi:putative phosphoribosyl transferase